MNKYIKLAITIQVIVMTLLVSCAPSVLAAGTTLTVCHATADATNPYEEITVVDGLNEHRTHTEDIYPVPASGCPANLLVIVDGKITICHATSNQNNPYEEITINVNGLNGHGEHENDVFPISAEEGCPSDTVTNTGKITICHATNSKKNAYNQITISENGLNGHDKHADDIIPMPASGCP